MTATQITKCLISHFISHAYRFTNIYFFANESDFLSFSRSGYSYDIEVKISRSDYFADFKKPRHKLMESIMKGLTHAVIKGTTYPWITKFWRRHNSANIHRKQEQFGFTAIQIRENTSIANRFFFAVPEAMIHKDEIPNYAGLLYITPTGRVVKIKEAPLLHKNKHDVKKAFNVIYSAYEGLLLNKYRNVKPL